MKSKLQLLSKLPQYIISKHFNTNSPLPISYTMGLTYHCQARCKTCRIYERKPVDEMKVDEWIKIFKNIKDSPYWITVTGGEPFLYKDIVEWYYMLTKYCKPAIVNIPTNGQLYDKILDSVWQMLKISPETQLIINVSLDHYDYEKNDEIRGIKGYFRQAVETVNALKQHQDKNFKVGIHSVISKWNVKDIQMIALQLSSLLDDPTHYITEIAENRNELGTVDIDISPKTLEYIEAIKWLKKANGNNKHTLIRAFRMNYYDGVINWLIRGENIPCYNGYASCQITPDGNVWDCCIKSNSMGNLRMYNYNFEKLWDSVKAQDVRRLVKECPGCPLANSYYTNSLFSVSALSKVIKELI